MGAFLLTLLLLIPVLFCPASDAWSLPPEDLEASGGDLGMDLEGSGSGGGAHGEILPEKSPALGSRKDSTGPTNDHRFATERVLKDQEVHPWDREAKIVLESRGIMESKEVLAGVIAGGVAGLVLAVLLGGILIYKWQKKDSSGYTQGHREEQYHTDREPNRAHRGEDMVLV